MKVTNSLAILKGGLVYNPNMNQLNPSNKCSLSFSR
jgi:hypothetical protein